VEVPLRIDRFDIRGELGRGGQGMVLLAYDPKLEREVAIKVLSQEHISSDATLQRFQREARSTAKLHHPNIVEVFDYSPADANIAYIVSERLEGKTLSQVLALRNEALAAPVAAAVAHEICLALQHAHERSVVHRDLKPDNVFWEPNGRIVLVDFGIAKAISKDASAVDLTKASEVLGTPYYLAPEIILRTGMSPRVDLFSLGALMHFLVTKSEAFAEESLLGVMRRIVAGAWHPLPASLPAPFIALVQRLLATDPNDRPKNADEVAEALLPIIALGSSPDPRRVLKNALANLQAETGEWHIAPPKALTAKTDAQLLTMVTSVTSVKKDQGTQVLKLPNKGEHTTMTTLPVTQPKAASAKKRSSAGLVLALAGLAIIALGAAATWALQKPRPSPVVETPPAPVETKADPKPDDLPAPRTTEAIAVPTPAEEPARTPPRAAPRNVAAKTKVEREGAKVLGLGTLRIVALPWADIYIDGEKQGTTPGFRMKVLSAGKHRVRATNPGYQANEKDVVVPADESVFVDLSFEATGD
jgi:serine/threonine protein kinase